MKMMVKMAFLFATLLLLTGVAFAGGNCACYEIYDTDLDYPEYSSYGPWEICLNYGDHSGTFGPNDLYLFFDGLSMQALSYNPSNNCTTYFKFHGHNNNVLTGMEYCDTIGRFTLWGHITDYDNCEAP